MDKNESDKVSPKYDIEKGNILRKVQEQQYYRS
jgi:hypothetical protein